MIECVQKCDRQKIKHNFFVFLINFWGKNILIILYLNKHIFNSVYWKQNTFKLYNYILIYVCWEYIIYTRSTWKIYAEDKEQCTAHRLKHIRLFQFQIHIQTLILLNVMPSVHVMVTAVMVIVLYSRHWIIIIIILLYSKMYVEFIDLQMRVLLCGIGTT